ncbi:MAG: GNAT family N-acetyltransferase [Acidobacteriota bacterium]|nr:GNAT family N-acetyltransferase [Acidobacteriota bacterium]
MTGHLHFRPATTASLEELAEQFNAAFAGYFYPQQVTAALLSRRLRDRQIDLQSSLLAFEGEKFAGLALLALRGSEGWCGGFGIVPEFRGRGRARELMAEFVTRARECGVKRLSLEVLTRNTAARRLYERAGLKVTRDLLILKRPPDLRGPQQAGELKEVEPPLLLRHFVRLHTVRPSWQRDLASLLGADNVRGLCLGEASAPDAYALFVVRPGGRTIVIDLAACDEESANALCEGVCGMEGTLELVNEPEGSPFVAALLSRGFLETDRQHEMACEL